MRSIVVFISCIFCLSNGQYPPAWEPQLECDMTITDRFPPGKRYNNYFRYYTFNTSYPTLINRDVRISTCIEKRADTLEGKLSTGGTPRLRRAVDPETTTRLATTSGTCPDGEQGQMWTWNSLPADQWVIGVMQQDSNGGKYKLTVECLNPDAPNPNLYANTNITQDFPRDEEWKNRSSKTISCGVQAYGTIDAVTQADFYQYTVTDYAQEIVFTTCIPENYFATSSSRTAYPTADSIGWQRITFYYWDFDRRRETPNGGWIRQQTSSSPCTVWTIGNAGSSTDQNVVEVSPGTYYIGVERFSSSYNGDYVLSMVCWNDATVAAATTYTAATSLPTSAPVTASPTSLQPTSAPSANTTAAPSKRPTQTPTTFPSQSFKGKQKISRKAINKGTISCGVHQHDHLQKKRSDYYKFQVVTGGLRYYFDSCMNDQTVFNACVRLYRLDDALPDWGEWDVENQNGISTFVGLVAGNCYDGVHENIQCNLLSGTLSAGTYAIEISGNEPATDYGEYILRMGCYLNQYDRVTPVNDTRAPSPAPTGITDIAPKDGKIEGDISCGITVQGEIRAKEGHFHRFVVTKSLDWIKFDTCDETAFNNYLFLYDYFNKTGVERYTYQYRDYSVGFHFRDDSTCNTLQVNDITPGIYYVNIDGYNYYFDFGGYTISMECSDNSAVAAASNYNEYGTGLEWWAILLIVLACLLCCGCIIFGICYWKKKQGGGGSSGDTEMAGNGNTESGAGGE